MSEHNSKDDDKYSDTSITSKALSPQESFAIEGIRRMFVDELQVDRIVYNEQTPAKRAAFAKQHGIAQGYFQVENTLSPEYKIGMFQPGARYDAWVRYSSDIAQTNPDKNSTVGIGIKLFNVPGVKAFEEESFSTTLDFVLQNTEVFFAATAEEMFDFKTAASTGKLDEFLQTHPESARILNEMENKTVNSLLTETLWSCVPFKFGPNNYCKFSLVVKSVAQPTRQLSLDALDYLEQDLWERLMNGPAELDFFVQLRNNPTTQSITSARSLWSEKEAIPVKVATLVLPQQNIRSRNQSYYGESLSFNIWRTLPEMIPVGSISEARKVVYLSSSDTRKQVNGQTIGEPTQPRESRMPACAQFQPTLLEPWPLGKTGNHIENLNSFPTTLVQPKYNFYVTNNMIFSGRDMPFAFKVIKAPKNIYGVIDGMVVQIDNTNKQAGTLRLVFENVSVKRISFGLSVKSFSSTQPGNLEIKVLDFKSGRVISDPIIASDENAVIYIEPTSGESFSLLTFNFTNAISIFELDNFEITFEKELTRHELKFTNGVDIDSAQLTEALTNYDIVDIKLANGSWAKNITLPIADNANINRILNINNEAQLDSNILIEGSSAIVITLKQHQNVSYRSTGTAWVKV